jgi:hypothetical protein
MHLNKIWLTLSQIKKTTILFIDTWIHPFGILVLIRDFKWFMTKSTNNHKDVLQILSKYLLIFAAFKQGV